MFGFGFGFGFGFVFVFGLGFGFVLGFGFRVLSSEVPSSQFPVLSSVFEFRVSRFEF